MQQTAALVAVLLKQGKQRLFFTEQAVEARQVAFGEGLEFVIDQLKQLLGGADIVGEEVNQGCVVHGGLLGVGRPTPPAQP